ALALQQAVTQKGLAHAGLAGQEREPLLVGESVPQRVERLFVAGAGVVAGAVRRPAERPGAEARMVCIHEIRRPCRRARDSSACPPHRYRITKTLTGPARVEPRRRAAGLVPAAGVTPVARPNP